MDNFSISSTTIIDPQTLQTICNLNIVIPVYDKVRKEDFSLLSINYVYFYF